MDELVTVKVSPREPESLLPVIGADRVGKFVEAGVRTRAKLDGRTFWNVNSTAAGGGVAEMLQSLLAYVLGAGIDTRWVVIPGDSDFYAITKRIHNGLHDSLGDGGDLGDAEHRHYATVTVHAADELARRVRPGDIILLHDPQTAGMARRLVDAGCHVAWRSHIGYEGHTSTVERTWEFLRRYVAPAQLYVFSRAAYAPRWLDTSRMSVIWPSIDPFSVKNQDLDQETVISILQQAGLLQGEQQCPPAFVRSDGSGGRVERKADVIGAGPLPKIAEPTIVQVSRWDALKDMAGVLRGFVDGVPRSIDARLQLVGPSVADVTDDPEGLDVFVECKELWHSLDEADRQRVQLITLPMDDLEENAAMVNAIQRNAAVVVQKSIAEGFGLTVSEATWKARPVIGSAVGGIQDQIVDGEDGILLADPHDLDAFGSALVYLLERPDERYRMGQNAKQRALAHFLGNRHLIQYADLIATIVD